LRVVRGERSSKSKCESGTSAQRGEAKGRTGWLEIRIIDGGPSDESRWECAVKSLRKGRAAAMGGGDWGSALPLLNSVGTGSSCDLRRCSADMVETVRLGCKGSRSLSLTCRRDPLRTSGGGTQQGEGTKYSNGACSRQGLQGPGGQKPGLGKCGSAGWRTKLLAVHLQDSPDSRQTCGR
jgi:hypothetical protein